MVTSRGALKPRRTVPPRTSTTWTSMSSPIRMVSPTLRVSVSTCTPPWVCWWPSLAVPGNRACSAVGARPYHDDTTPVDWLSAHGLPNGMHAVGEHHLPGLVRHGIDHQRRAEVGRRRADVPVGHGDQAVQAGLGGVR